jgi:glutamate-1-semialdehyde aminotransferase/spore coat polysaccharide biosynthesis protein SpsF (cytidylyltransferase family)
MIRVLAITQARYGSSRLPGKVLLKVNQSSLLQIHLERILRSKKIDKLVLATTYEEHVNDLIKIAESIKIPFYQGSTLDVLDRFYQTAKLYSPQWVVRLTSDCPLIDSDIIDETIERCIMSDVDYCSNTLFPSFPDGMDVEVFRFSALETAWREARSQSDREHVTPYIWRNSDLKGGNLFKAKNISGAKDYSGVRLTVDQQEDFVLIQNLIEKMGTSAKWMDYLLYMEENPSLGKLNEKIKRNEGYMESKKVKIRNITNFTKSQEYREKIHDLIPGGSHTYSKGDDQFPELSPAAIAYGKGSHVWDIDGNEYLDCSMGLTSVSLGHAYEPVIRRVKAELDNGVNFQRPSYLEKEMAEKFLSLVPGHDMIKYAKNGSIVTTAAVKIARAYTGRKLVAFPGDHPFYSYDDWFIGKTACSLGVPEEITNLSVTFKSCNIDSLKDLFNQYPNQIACIIMEPERSTCGNGCSCALGVKEYLEQVLEVVHAHGALFIIDEMITGFKTALPGSITRYGIVPDMATWGKGIANGFSFCALTGKKEIMELGGIRSNGKEKVFLISTTHGGETHALTAGLATIDEFLTKDVVSHNHKIGDYFIKQCNEVIAQRNLSRHIQLIPCNWMVIFVFKNKSEEVSAGFRTFAMQEMIKRGVLFQGAFVPCFSHTLEDVDYFTAALDQTLEVYGKALQDGFEAHLTGEPAKPVFRKYL